MTDAKQKLIDMIKEMDADKADALLEFACNLAKPSQPKSPLRFVEFSGKTKGLILLEHEECETGEQIDQDKRTRISALIRNDTNETFELEVNINYYDENGINVGSDCEYSPKLKPGKSWRMIHEQWVHKSAKQYDLHLESLKV